MSVEVIGESNVDIHLDKDNCLKNEELAVDIKHVYFEYNSEIKVLNDLSLQIPKEFDETGKISALLGSNGTGKTTLIRSILGRLKLKSGSIKVFGSKPGSKYSDVPGLGVGYMPQELALFEEFSVNEILRYYGAIYHMNDKQLKQRICELIEILNLPEKSRIISRLSGGQKRRVSIAITMIHKPKLIILDEPTVGVDSILRHRIWQYLEQSCLQNGHTVLITTHYIEEARSAHNVAFMSYGTILKQSHPQTLLEEFNCQTLESVFLYLCQKKREIRKPVDFSQTNEAYVEQDNNVETDDGNSKADKARAKNFDIQRVKAMLFKYYIISVRRPVFLYIFYFIPFIVLTCARLAIGQYPTNIPMSIYNEDQNPEFSQLIIDNIDRDHVNVKMVSTRQSAYESVLNGNNYMSVVFGTNFSDDFQYRLKDISIISDEEIENSKIGIYIDFSNAPMAIFVLEFLLRALNKFLRQTSDVLGQNAERFFHTVSLEEPIYGGFELLLSDLFVPGIVLALSQTLPLVISSLQIIFDRKNSCIERIIVSGVRPIEIICAHFIQISVLIGTQLLLTLFIAFGVYNNTQIGSYLDIYLLLFLIGLQGMVIGLAIALIFQDEVGILVGILSLILPMWIVSGIFWPIESIPFYFREIVKLGPLCQPLIALRSIMLRGWTLSHPFVYMGFSVCILYLIIISIVVYFLFTKLIK